MLYKKVHRQFIRQFKKGCKVTYKVRLIRPEEFDCKEYIIIENPKISVPGGVLGSKITCGGQSIVNGVIHDLVLINKFGRIPYLSNLNYYDFKLTTGLLWWFRLKRVLPSFITGMIIYFIIKLLMDAI